MNAIDLNQFFLLSRSQRNDYLIVRKEKGIGLEHLFSHNYDWLESDVVEHSWKVKFGRGKTQIIHFDANKIGGGKLSNNPKLMDDMKLAYILFRESKVKGQLSVYSYQSSNRLVSYMKRYLNEIYLFDGISSPHQLDKTMFEQITKNLSKKASVSQKYVERLVAYFDELELSDIPIVRDESKKNKPRIDVAKIADVLGLNIYQFKHDESVMSLIAQKCLELKELYEKNIEIQYEHILNNSYDNFKIMRNKKDYQSQLQFLENMKEKNEIYSDLFNYNWVPFIFNRDELVSEADFSEQYDLDDRTRDIPPYTFISLMDAAARFVLDYSDELFEAELYLTNKHREFIESGYSSYQAGKMTNAIAKTYKSKDSRRHSPFPLAAYKLAKKGQQIIPSELKERVAEDIANAIPPKETMNREGLTKGQYDYHRKLSGDIIPYNRNLPNTGLSLNKALYQFLPFCCTINIFALSARREIEVFGLKVGCVENDFEGLWLNSYVAKTWQQDYRFSTVALLDKAVKLLERLSEKGRKALNSDSLFVFDDSFDRPPINMRSIVDSSESFFDFIGLERDPDGKHWKLSEHQFRRFFVIMYFYRYDKTDANALMHELGHTDWSMTLRYLTLKLKGKALREYQSDYNDIKAQRVLDYAVREDLGGEMFSELKNILKQTVRFTDEKRREQALKLIQDGSYALDFIPSGVCFGNTPSRKKLSKCYQNGHVMLHKACDQLCSGCPNQLSIPEIRDGEMKMLDDSGDSIILNNLAGDKHE